MNRSTLARAVAAWLCMVVAGGGHAQRIYDDDGDEVVTRKERSLELPGVPVEANLLEFDAGRTTQNRFFIDGNSIAVGEDDEVRYIAVVKTQGGATNVSYEGIRCGTRQFKVYYFGRSDGTWVKPRSSGWSLIEKQALNPHRQILYRDVFCALETVGKPEQMRHALRRLRPSTSSGEALK